MLHEVSEHRFEQLGGWIPAGVRAQEYWSNADESVLGVVLLDLTDKDWSVAVLRRTGPRQCEADYVEASIESQMKAQFLLHQKMTGL
jgi:hypothetical protein